jgi:hypothetical protein
MCALAMKTSYGIAMAARPRNEPVEQEDQRQAKRASTM